VVVVLVSKMAFVDELEKIAGRRKSGTALLKALRKLSLHHGPQSPVRAGPPKNPILAGLYKEFHPRG
jgi:hypothetical protein